MSAGRKLSLAEHTERERKKQAERGGGGGSWKEGRLKNWHKKEELTKTRSGEKVGEIRVLLSTHAPMVELAVHSWPKQLTIKKDNVESTSCWSFDHNCLEDLDLIDDQYKVDDKGLRVRPPVVCPICRLTDWVRREIMAGRINWTQNLFTYTQDKGEATTLSAGGMCNQFSARDMSDEDKEELKKAGVQVRFAFKQNALAKTKFLYALVDIDDVSKGLQSTVESKSLGQQITRIIDDRMSDLGERGDPAKNPYPLKFRYFPDKDPKEQYQVSYLAWSDLEESGYKQKDEAIEACRSEKIPASFEKLRGYPNIKQLRQQIEAAALVKGIPFAQIFGPAETRCDDKGWYSDGQPEEKPKAPAPEESGEETDGDEDSGDVDTAECGACNAEVPVDALVCPKCGADFSDDGGEAEAEPAEPPPPPPPPPPPKAVETVAKGKGAGRTGKAPKKTVERPTPGNEPVDPDDKIPW